jgi:hypothetical protein
MTAGAYPLTGVANLPNVTIASPGEIWSDRKTSGIVIPGAAVAPVAGGAGGRIAYKQLVALDTPDIDQVAVAMRQVEIPDVNSGPGALGPNQIVNQAIAAADWLRTVHTGVLHLTLVEPRADYTPGQKVGWAVAAARPTGKASGTGAWSNAGILSGTAIFEVREYRTYGEDDEGILTVRFLRSNQF